MFLIWEFLVEYFDCIRLFCAYVSGCVSSLRISSTMLVQLFAINMSIGRMFCLSYAFCGVMPMILRNLCCCFVISFFAFALVDIRIGTL